MMSKPMVEPMQATRVPDTGTPTFVIEEADDTLVRWYPLRIRFGNPKRAMQVRDELRRQDASAGEAEGILDRRDALREIAEAGNAIASASGRAEPGNAAAPPRGEDKTERRDEMEGEAPPWPNQSFVLHPVPHKRARTPIDDAIGRVCAQAIIPYPPGIPVICPGEEITEEIVTYAKTLRALGQNVMGIDGDGCVLVGV